MENFTSFAMKAILLFLLTPCLCNSQSATVDPSPTISSDIQNAEETASISASATTNSTPSTPGNSSGSIATSLSPTPVAQSSAAGPGATVSSVATLSSVELACNRNLHAAIANLDMVASEALDPLETREKDKSNVHNIEEFMNTATSLASECETNINKTLDIDKFNRFSALQLKTFPDCLAVRKNVFPNTSDPVNSNLGTASITQTFECPFIVKNDSATTSSPRRRRREVEITMEVPWPHIFEPDDDIPDHYRHTYHYYRNRARRDVQAVGNVTECKPLPCNVSRINTRIKITSMNYTAALASEVSPEFVDLNGRIKNTLDYKVSNHTYFTNTTLDYKFVKSSFRTGSIIADFLVDVNTTDVPKATGILTSAVSGSSFGNFTLDGASSSVNEVTVVDGNWANWGTWQPNCNNNYEKARTRTCTNPAPAYGGAPCQGRDTELKKCDCNRVLHNTGGNITSPFFPSNYPTNVLCMWTLTVPVNHTVELDLAEFHLEKDKKCFYDYLKITDGNETDSPELLPRTCGTQNHRKIVSSGQILKIYFHSDRDVTFPGFRAVWKSVAKIWTPPKPVDYVPQNVTVINLITCPSFNNTVVPSGRGSTCPAYSPEVGCIFDKPVFIISCYIGMRMNRDDLPLTGDNAVKLTFPHVMHKQLFPAMYIGHKYCVTWNKTARQSSGILTSGMLEGGWTRRGCKVKKTNLTHTECECDHTGMFAVVAAKKVIYHKLKLLPNTYTGVGVSLAILLAAAAHIVYKVNIHGGEVMRLCMCGAIIYMEIVFVVGANVKAEQTLCGFLAFSVYFSVLAEFCWLLLHALRLQGKIKQLFASGLNIDAVYICVGWGLPLLLSLIAIGIQIDLKNPSDVCWTAAAGGSMWGYGAPLLIIIICNLAVLVTLLIPTKERLEKFDYHQMKYRVIKDAIVLAFLGTTCITAYQSVVQESFQPQYYLTASVILQAVCMFVFGREGRKDFVKKVEETPKELEQSEASQHTNVEAGSEKAESAPKSPENADEEKEEEKEDGDGKGDGKGRHRKRRRAKPQQEKIKVSTLKNLNIYKEDGQYVIEA